MNENKPHHKVNDTYDIEEVFLFMDEAMKSVKSITSLAQIITSKPNSNSVITANLTSKTIINPFTYHARYTVLDGNDEHSAWYGNDQHLYMFTNESKWIKTISPNRIKLTHALYNTDHLQQFIQYKKLFKLTVEENYYIITYVGPDANFKEVFNEGAFALDVAKYAEEYLKSLGDVSIVGTVEMVISKATFLISKHQEKIRSTLHHPTKRIEVIDETNHIFTYNDVTPFSIPSDVIDYAIDANL